MKKLFVTAIDTDAGKTQVTGLLARELAKKGLRVITFKLVQTGNEHISEDIITHRKIMGIPLTEWDKQGITCGQVFKYPSSPHLAASLENKTFHLETVLSKLDQLTPHFDICIIEGAGGIMVPLTKDYLIIDCIKEMDVPTVVVTHGKLGSINHTLLTLKAIRHKKINLKGLIYNDFF